MARYKQYNYSQRLMVPVSLEEQLVTGTLEHAIHYVVENELETDIFDNRFKNDFSGRPAISPKILLKVVLLGYSRGLNSSRKIEKACRENIIFMALTCGQSPDHATIANFVSLLENEVKHAFNSILLVCLEMNLLGGTFFALDGCKMPGNASKRWSGTHKELRHKKEKIDAAIKKIMKQHISQDQIQHEAKTKNERTETDFQTEQLKRLKNQSKRIKDWLSSNDPKPGKRSRELKSNITDNDTAKMSTSHGTIQGYNAQAMVDDRHQIIVAGLASGKGQDAEHMLPMLEITRENLGFLGYPMDHLKNVTITADSSYFSQKGKEDLPVTTSATHLKMMSTYVRPMIVP